MINIMKYVIITGALGGIGVATIKKFALEGYNVIGIDNIEGGSNTYLTRYVKMDLSRNDLDTDMIELIRMYPPTVIVHLAAIQELGGIDDIDIINSWDRTMNVNVRSILQLVQIAKNDLVRLGGSVVIVSSIHAYCSSKDIILYSVSKNALTGVIRNLAIELPIRVNGVAPGAVNTEMLRKGLMRGNNEEELEIRYNKLSKRVNILTPEQIANPIYFLASDQSSGMTGQTIIVDGGASIKLSSEV